MNVLIVDDEQFSVDGMLDGISWETCHIDRVFTAGTAREARKILLNETVDMLLLDVEMPVENGLELLYWIREQGYTMPCAFLTCHAQFNYAQEALRLQCMDYILKPADYSKVEAVILKMADGITQSSEKKRMEHYGQQWIREKADEAMENQKPSVDPQKIVERTADYIMNHLSEKLTLEKLADQVHLNPDYLNRLFRKYRNISINKFIINERMMLAAELLKQPGISATAVALEVGYINYANFLNMFKKVHGYLPSEIDNN